MHHRVEKAVNLQLPSHKPSAKSLLNGDATPTKQHQEIQKHSIRLGKRELPFENEE